MNAAVLYDRMRVVFSRFSRSSLISLAWRGFWLVMLLSHARAVASAWVSIGAGDAGLDPARPVILTLASLFFVLKFIDVTWLRFKTDRRSIAALAMIVLLLHAQSFGITSDKELLPQMLATASAVLFLEPVQRRWEQIYVRIFAQLNCEPADGQRPPRWLATLRASVQQLPQWILTHTAAPTRGPPA